MKNNNIEGKIICVVGADGVGKTSVIKELNKIFIKNNINTLLTREPGGVESSEKIREIILNNDLDAITECLLFASARRENVLKNLIPALKEKKIILMDRYFHCSLVYQGLVEGVDFDTVFNINKLVIEDCMPDLTIILDLDSKIAIQRMNSDSNRVNNRFDKQSEDYHKKVREGYLSLKNIINNTYVVNANQPLNYVVDDSLNIIEKHFNLKLEK